MTFQNAVENTPGLNNAYRPGLQALGKNSQVIECRDMRRIVGSVDVDAALTQQFPGNSRWDYGIGLRSGDAQIALWVEVHPASTGQVETVLNKLAWLKIWLRAIGTELLEITPAQSAYYWVATDAGVHITSNSPQARRLFQSGLSLPRRRINVC